MSSRGGAAMHAPATLLPPRGHKRFARQLATFCFLRRQRWIPDCAGMSGVELPPWRLENFRCATEIAPSALASPSAMPMLVRSNDWLKPHDLPEQPACARRRDARFWPSDFRRRPRLPLPKPPNGSASSPAPTIRAAKSLPAPERRFALRRILLHARWLLLSRQMRRRDSARFIFPAAPRAARMPRLPH